MTVAFIGAAMANRFKQSVVLGYILVGIIIGPYMVVSIGSFTYTGMIHDTGFIEDLSDLGLILLMFFVGLEFSASKLKKVGSPAIVLSIINISVDMFTGVLLGFALGWPVVDTIFLSAVIAMSCAAVAMKSLMELGRLSNPETEFLLGVMVVEDFISAVFLAAVDGLVVNSGGSTNIEGFIIGAVIFIIFFIFLALIVIPRVVRQDQCDEER